MNKEKHIEVPQARVKKPVENRKKSIVIFLVLPAVLTILFPGGGIFYLIARFCPYTMTFFFIHLLYLVVLVFIIYCFFLGIMELSGRRGKRTRNEKLLIVAEAIVPLMFVVLLVIFIFLGFTDEEFLGPRFKFFMYGLRDRVKNKVDIGATRAWLQSLGDEDYNDSDLKYKRVSKSKRPEPLRVLKPGKVFLSADENGNAKVRLVLGSSPIEGHWGVEIGAENMKIPPSDFGMYREYRLPLEPGVYIWLSD